MKDCHTFVRGTIRFDGFCSIISAFHDIGLSSDDMVPANLKTFKDILASRLSTTKVQELNRARPIINLITNIAANKLQTDLLMRIDFSYLLKNSSEGHIMTGMGLDKHDEATLVKSMQGIIKSLDYIEFFSDKTPPTKDKSYLNVLSEIMASKLAMNDNDRDLVAMVHEFTLKNKDNKEWKKTATMVVTGDSKASGGYSVMSKTVGYTTAIGTRLVLEGKIPQRGVLSPIYPEIYEPILKELEKVGISMKEEDSMIGSNGPMAKM